MTAALMIQGCGSDVGKSVLVAGLCRLFADRGLKVRPFKPQNMSNNAAVTVDGGEIGRAQALQARACRTPATVHMNPVLIKPHSDTGAQLVVRGRVAGQRTAGGYQRYKHDLLPTVIGSFEELRADADLILVEGAGSPAEVNLREGDIANMGFARAAGTPVALVGDIDRGHVIAALVGAHVVLAPEDRAMVRGFIINKFRGNPTLFETGRSEIAARTGWPDLGMAPWRAEARRLPAEDAVVLQAPRAPGAEHAVRIVVPLLPSIANFDDFDALAAEPAVAFRFVTPGQPLPGDADLVILPGSKAVRRDLEHLRSEGWDIDLLAHARRGGRVLGICGGYQMLGRRIADPDGLEGPAGASDGLGLLQVETVLGGEKILREVTGRLCESSASLAGYEIHLGQTSGPDTARPFARLEAGRADGARSADGRIAGAYVHGLFDHAEARAAILAQLGAPSAGGDRADAIEADLDAWAAVLAASLDIDNLSRIAGL
ncbi:MAG TPA: cobyric acid synthase [Caulobacteraceae bacterium]|jgi:adenosylcobyric acid synthase